MKRILTLAMLILLTAGCSTSGQFKVPAGSKVYVDNRPEPLVIAANGQAETVPFTWSSMGVPPRSGIPYRLEKNGKTVKEGRLRAKLRVVSFFWPPLAIAYWPVGFNPEITYDLVNDKQQ